MNMLTAIGAMLATTARDWPGIANHDASPPEINHRPSDDSASSQEESTLV